MDKAEAGMERLGEIGEIVVYGRRFAKARTGDERPAVDAWGLDERGRFVDRWTFTVTEDVADMEEGLTICVESDEECVIGRRDMLTGDVSVEPARAVLSLHNDRAQGYFASFGVPPEMGIGERAYGKPAETLDRAIENLMEAMDRKRAAKKMASRIAIGWAKTDG